MKTLFALTLFCLAILPTSASAMSFLDKEHSQKLARESCALEAQKQTGSGEMSPLQLFASPIQPSWGKLMMGVNVTNTLRLISPKLAKKLARGKSLIEQYVDNLVETDEEVVKFRNDDRPLRNWKMILRALKDEKRRKYTEYVMRMAL